MKPIKAIFGKPPFMGTVNALGTTINSTAGAHTAAVTVSVGDYLVAVALQSNGQAASGTVTDSQGGTWSYISYGYDNLSGGPDYSCAIFYRSAVIATAGALNVTHTPAASPTSTGGGVSVVAIRGPGTDAIFPRQYYNAEDPANGVPSFTYPGLPLPRSCHIAVTHGTNTAATPSGAGWTSMNTNSYTSPTLIWNIVACPSNSQLAQTVGFTGSLTAWGGCTLEIGPAG